MPCLSASCAMAGATKRAPTAAAPAITLNALRRLNLMQSRPLRHLRCLVLVPPPHRRKCRATVFRQDFGTTESVPPRRTNVRISPLRHHKEVPQQHPVEGLGSRNELGAILGENDSFDQPIDDRIFDTDEVA